MTGNSRGMIVSVVPPTYRRGARTPDVSGVRIIFM